MTIWIVDDDATLRLLVHEVLAQQGLVVREFDQPFGVIEALDTAPELILLDVRMPGKPGTDLCREIRAVSQVPIIFLSSADEPIDRVLGLELGADDYICKPFHPRELVARVRAVLRRHHASSEHLDEGDKPSVVGALRLDPVRLVTTFHDQAIDLTPTEFRLLQTLMANAEKVFTRGELMRGAYDGVRVSGKTIDSHIRRLRDSFKPFEVDPIRTVRGVGYALDVQNLSD